MLRPLLAVLAIAALAHAQSMSAYMSLCVCSYSRLCPLIICSDMSVSSRSSQLTIHVQYAVARHVLLLVAAINMIAAV